MLTSIAAHIDAKHILFHGREQERKLAPLSFQYILPTLQTVPSITLVAELVYTHEVKWPSCSAYCVQFSIVYIAALTYFNKSTEADECIPVNCGSRS